MNSHTENEIQELVLGEIRRLAPEVDARSIQPDRPLRDQVDLDSYDFLSLVVGVHRKLAIDIPESDYARLGTLRGFVTYIKEKEA